LEALYTIGYEKTRLRQFITRLKEAEVDAVLDTRRRPNGGLAGYARQEDLSFLLQSGFGIDYVYLEDLAPADWLLKQFKQDKDWEAYEIAFRAQMEERAMIARAVPVLERYRHPCLLCYDRRPERCHNRLLAEGVRAIYPDLPVHHLLG
jgi:uncharacterized protein (DUF488 family)